MPLVSWATPHGGPGDPASEARPSMGPHDRDARAGRRQKMFNGCNAGLARFRDAPALLQAAIAYLMRTTEAGQKAS